MPEPATLQANDTQLRVTHMLGLCQKVDALLPYDSDIELVECGKCFTPTDSEQMYDHDGAKVCLPCHNRILDDREHGIYVEDGDE